MSRNMKQIPARNPARIPARHLARITEQIPAKIPSRIDLYQNTAMIPVQNYFSISC